MIRNHIQGEERGQSDLLGKANYFILTPISSVSSDEVVNHGERAGSVPQAESGTDHDSRKADKVEDR